MLMAQIKRKGRNKTCSICGDPIPDISPEELTKKGYWRLGTKHPHRVYFSYYIICPKHSGQEVGEFISRTFTWIKGEGSYTPSKSTKKETTLRIADDQLIWIVEELERRLSSQLNPSMSVFGLIHQEKSNDYMEV